MKLEKLTEYKVKFLEWWSTLAVREQRAVTAGSVVLSLFILYAGIWSPILGHLTTMRKQIQTEQKNLLWMQTAEKEMQKYAGNKPQDMKSMTPLALISLLQKQIKQAGLEPALTGLKQAENDSVEMHFQKIEFDKLMTMLTSIVKEYHVNISQMTATAEATPGVVNADVSISLKKDR